MEQTKIDNEVLSSELREKVKAKIRGSPKEDQSNIMDVGVQPPKILWRPNNYRLQINVKKKSDITIEKVKSDMGDSCSVGNRNKVLFVNFSSHVKLAYGRDTLTAIYSQHIIGGHKETFLIEGNVGEIESYITDKKNVIKKELEEALFGFARKYSIVKPFQKPKWSRFEDWFKGEEFVDSIPSDVIIHADLFKKVYDEGIEFKNGSKDFEPTENLVNYIHNASLKNNYPDLVEELASLHKLLEAKFNGLVFLKNNFRSMEDLKKYRFTIENLSTGDLEKFHAWLFDNFCVGGELCEC